ncbi:scaffolding protein [Caudoviricetes sp.]|nr:scaffolding protein [Caudoviricetes sp.]
MENTNPTGSESLNVNQAASAFLGLMGDDSGADEGQPEESIQASDESVEESDDNSAEYSGEEVQEEQPKPKYRAKVDGEEIEVEIDELINGYQRTADYTKKSQALAEQRKAIEAERVHLEQVKQERQAYAQKLQALNQFLGQQNQGENLEALKEVDPIGYAVKVAERSEREKQLAVVRAEQQRIAQQQQAEQQQSLQKHIASEAEKLNASIPELASPKGDEIRKQIREYAKSQGWSDQELGSVYDHRAVLTLYKAMKFEQLQKSKPEIQKKVQQAPKMLKSGTSSPSTQSQQEKQVMQRLRQSGKVRDAAAAFERFL